MHQSICSFRFLLICLLLLSIAACQRAYKAPIEQLQKSTAAATTAISTYYNALNQQERDLYFLTLLLNPGQRVEEVNAQGKETPLMADAFDPAAVQARIALLAQLSLYADNLSALAGNEAPKQLRTNMAALGSSLGAIQTTFADLQRQRADEQAAAYVSPIGTLIGIVGEAALANQRDKAVRQAILQGEAPINQLLDFLTKDLDRYVFLAQKTGDDQKLTQLMVAYNNLANRKAMPHEELKKRLAEIQRAAEQLRLTRTNHPSDVLRALKKAHVALIGVAKQTSTFEQFQSTVFAYEAQVDTFLKAAQRINELRKADHP
ncbi:hypothetical protein J2I47_23225 [Fibrella sp. HMF5335]|uniref:Uncharacterized protein n=1 Tax=Fibrella rubiginis TaxID=2817060 RepID=A0A939GJI8_9BACT|nr:hypothetical protein [Fibrella rubiginis]MBO0939481.1 hypothetical protein [Fibrella rubiginis]